MKLGVIGVGKMASAILDGILINNTFFSHNIYLYDPVSQATDSFESRGCKVLRSIDELISISDIILIAVKPNHIDNVLSDISVNTDGKCFISIAAGISIDYIKSSLNKNTYVIRAMPNTPIMVGCGATAVAMSEHVPDEFRNKALLIFSSGGDVVILEESLINAATSVNGSGPAYFFTMAEEMVKVATEQGIEYEAALLLTAKTMEGAARMLLKSGKSPAELVKDVSSPGGTTIAALEEMTKGGFRNALKNGMFACIERAEEIGK